MTNFLPLNTIETTCSHTYDYNVTIYYRTAEGAKESETYHRYTANELLRTVETSIRDNADPKTACAWARNGAKATCAKVYCWKTGETFWFSVR